MAATADGDEADPFDMGDLEATLPQDINIYTDFIAECERADAEGAADSVAPARPLVLVLLGKMGQGKSSTANSILGHAAFETRRAAASVTNSCAVETLSPYAAVERMPTDPMAVLRGGGGGGGGGGDAGSARSRGLVVIDTPGLGDPSKHEATTYHAIMSVLDMTEKTLGSLGGGEGPEFAFVLTLGVHNRIGSSELNELIALRSVFGGRMWSRSTVVFTHGDLLTGPGETLESYLKGERQNEWLGRGEATRIPTFRCSTTIGHPQKEIPPATASVAAAATTTTPRPPPHPPPTPPHPRTHQAQVRK